MQKKAQLHEKRKQIAILDFGSQYSHLIARRIRESNIFCELYSYQVEASVLRQNLVIGIILSGGPASVYDPDSPHVGEDVWKLIDELKIPVLGICYGMQEIAHTFGGVVAPSAEREFGHAIVHTEEHIQEAQLLFKNVDQAQMWMSHGDKVTKLPDDFVVIAHTENSEHAAIAHTKKKIYGLQFHPEVTHSIAGEEILKNFAVTMCCAHTDWNMHDIAQEFITEVRELVGPHGRVIGAVSGGVDSSVAALLLHHAIGDRFHAVLVDNGCLRKNEAKNVKMRLQDHLGINLRCIDAEDRFLSDLSGISDPEQKRKIIGRIFIEIFQEEASKLEGGADFLLQGTLYPDVIESVSYKGISATIKTHHNVGGLPAKMKMKLIEPLRELFKDEVRALGISLGLKHESVWRHPFPGPGLAIRVLGEITKERLSTLREADDILMKEIIKAGVYKDISQAAVVLLPIKSVGVMGDQRTYEQVCAIRCVQTTDFMTADWYHMDYNLLRKISGRIINEVKGINRVCYDISSKPPATIEWE
jgi:GMP synthase (glutamine-hydrolysing)